MMQAHITQSHGTDDSFALVHISDYHLIIRVIALFPVWVQSLSVTIRNVVHAAVLDRYILQRYPKINAIKFYISSKVCLILMPRSRSLAKGVLVYRVIEYVMCFTSQYRRSNIAAMSKYAGLF
jgi:hypothetical protein